MKKESKQSNSKLTPLAHWVMPMRNIHLAVLLVLAPISAIAQTPMQTPPLTVFGIPLLVPFSMPECEFQMQEKPLHLQKQQGEKEPKYVLTSPMNESCYERNKIGSTEPLHEESVFIKFPIGKKPNLSKYDSLSARLLDNKVQRLWFWTLGLSSQKYDLGALIAKFGQPTEVTMPKVQNKMGATFETIEAAWKLPNDMTVVFRSVDGSIDRGQVVIATLAGNAEFNAALKTVLDKNSSRGTGL